MDNDWKYYLFIESEERDESESKGGIDPSASYKTQKFAKQLANAFALVSVSLILGFLYLGLFDLSAKWFLSLNAPEEHDSLRAVCHRGLFIATSVIFTALIIRNLNLKLKIWFPYLETVLAIYVVSPLILQNIKTWEPVRIFIFLLFLSLLLLGYAVDEITREEKIFDRSPSRHYQFTEFFYIFWAFFISGICLGPKYLELIWEMTWLHLSIRILSWPEVISHFVYRRDLKSKTREEKGLEIVENIKDYKTLAFIARKSGSARVVRLSESKIQKLTSFPKKN
jgi:hypothetical protein